MQATRIRATVRPGGRLELVSPDLPVGQEVEAIILHEVHPKMPMLELLASLPRFERSPEEWEAIEREFQEERNAWDR